MNLSIEPLSCKHFAPLHALFDEVCKEERFLAFCAAGSPEATHAYYQRVLDGGHAHFVALADGALVGWCDVLPLAGEMRAHCGVLGIGLGRGARQGSGAQAHGRGACQGT